VIQANLIQPLPSSLTSRFDGWSGVWSNLGSWAFFGQVQAQEKDQILNLQSTGRVARWAIYAKI
jgi:hypothetical protein